MKHFARLALTIAVLLAAATGRADAPSASTDGKPSPPHSAPPLQLYELRPASAAIALIRDLGDPVSSHLDRDAPLENLVATLDLPAFAFSTYDAPAYILPADPASAAILDAALAQQGWQEFSHVESRDATNPQSAINRETRIYVRGEDNQEKIYAEKKDNHIILAPSPYRLAHALEALPFLPSTLPAGGTVIFQRSPQHPSHDYIAPVDDPTITYGLSLDGDTLDFQLMLTYPEGSPFAAWLRSLHTVSIPDETACVNRPGAIATFAVSPLPPLPEDIHNGDLPRGLRDLLTSHPHIPFSIAIFPPPPADRPDTFFSLLAFAGFSDPDAPLRAISRVTGLLATNAVHRDIPILTHDWDFALPKKSFFWGLLHCVRTFHSPFPSFVAIPGTGVLAASEVPPSALPAAIDALLDGELSTRHFSPSPALLSAFPTPDAPPVAILHADLRALAAAYPENAENIRLDRVIAAVPPSAPLSLDAYLHVASDDSLILRLRVPADFVRAHTGKLQSRPLAAVGTTNSLSAAAVGSGVPPPSPRPPSRLLEHRSYATATRALAPLGLIPYHPDEAPYIDVLRDRDAPLRFLYFDNANAITLFPLETRDAILAVCAAQHWTIGPDTTDGLTPALPPSRAFTNFYASVSDCCYASESADALREALPLIANLPNPFPLPVQGAVAEQSPGEALARALAPDIPPALVPDLANNVATFSIGLDADPDRDAASIHAVLRPVPGSELDIWVRAIERNPRAIPREATLGDAHAIFAAVAPLPLLPRFLRELLPPRLAEHIADRTISAALLPPADDNRARAALFYASTPDPARSFGKLDRWFCGLLTNRPHSTTVLFEPGPHAVFAWSGPRDYVYLDLLAAPGTTWRIAPLPNALLVGRNAPDATLDAAIDFVLDDGLSTCQFAHSSAFPTSAPPPIAILHADLRDLLRAYPATAPLIHSFLSSKRVAAPLPLDATFSVENGALVLRLRCPPPCDSHLYILRQLLRLARGWQPSPAVEGASPPDGGPSARQSTPIDPTPFLGYPKAYVLSNPRLHAVVVPALGRLAFLSFAPDAPNLLRLNPALAESGALPPDPAARLGGFVIGGDWAWPVAQSRWGDLTIDGRRYGLSWPPPALLGPTPCDASAWRESDGSQHVLLTRHYPTPVSATLTRHFIVSGAPVSVLRCDQTLVRDPAPAVDESPLALTLWNVTQFAAPHRLGCNLPTPDASPSVLLGTLPPGSHHVNSLNNSHTFIFEPPSECRDLKLSFPAPPSPLYNRTTASLTAHSGNANLHIYTHAPDHHGELYYNPLLSYAQLETLSPDLPPSASALSNTLHYWIGPTTATRPFFFRSQSSP